MTTRAKSLAPTAILAAAGLGLLLIAGCSTKNVVPSSKIDYKSVSTQKTTPLEVPPDLPKPAASDRYAIPDAAGGTATLSEYNQDRPNKVQAQSGVVPKFEGAKVMRAGTQRWLQVDAKPDAVWPVLREFWQQQGFVIAQDDPTIGIMETDWAENRAKIPQGFIRDTVGKVFDQAYSSPELDRFKTRVERGPTPDTTEIYITHRGAYEMYVADANLRQTGKTAWQPRESDPNLEAEMLSRLMVRFGTPETVASTTVKAAKVVDPRATLTKGSDGTPVLMLKDDFDRAWRRVGLSLDRRGFSVQDRNREAGLYYVKYLSPPSPKKEDSGVLDKLAFWKKDEPNKPGDYRVAVVAEGKGSEVKVLNSEGKPDKSEAATQMLAVLQEDLR